MNDINTLAKYPKEYDAKLQGLNFSMVASCTNEEGGTLLRFNVSFFPGVSKKWSGGPFFIGGTEKIQ